MSLGEEDVERGGLRPLQVHSDRQDGRRTCRPRDMLLLTSPPPPFPAAASHPAVDLRPLRHVLPLPQHGTLKGESRACPATPSRPSLVLLPPSSVIISYYSYFRLGGPFSLFPKPCPPTLSSAKFALPPSPSPLPPPSPPPCDQGQVRRGRPAPCPPGGDDVAIAASRR